MSVTLGVQMGPRLLAHLDDGPGLPAHRARFGELPGLDRDNLLDLCTAANLRGRGGAGFRFAIKLSAVIERARLTSRPVVVVNSSEGEPASHKDAALAAVRPHLVLDGALLVASALAVSKVHLVLPSEDHRTRECVRRAIDERSEPTRFVTHLADNRFVAGQARAVLELMAGRPNLPVTAWQPEAFKGHRDRPTLLSNAETWAQLAALVLQPHQPETTLLSLNGEASSPRVVEVVDGTPWADVLGHQGSGPFLVGGYHGRWVTAQRLLAMRCQRDEMAAAGLALGAGAVIGLAEGECPLTMTSRIVSYLATQSAQRCGPCFNGLPAMAASLSAIAAGSPAAAARLTYLCSIVERRGACAHPDGTVGLVRSLLSEFPTEIAAHLAHGCAHDTQSLVTR